MPGLILILLILLIVIVYVTIYNRIKSLKNKVDQSKSGIDVALNKRFDLIPNLVECVKGYAKHEEKVLTEVTAEREAYQKNNSIENGARLNRKCGQILALAEQYPDLKASNQFLELQSALQKTESELSAARRLYNSDATMYNTEIQKIPTNIVAMTMGAKRAELFELDDEAKRENIKVKFD